MNFVYIDGPLTLLNLRTLQKVFETFADLDNGSFSIVEKMFPDGSSRFCFEYPTDFSIEQAEEIVSIISEELSRAILANLFNKFQF